MGLDLLHARTHRFRERGGYGIVGTAVALPFAAATFDVVVSTGLLHHLPDPAAHAALREMVRVARPKGRVAVFDAVWPEPAWRRPVAWAVRRADRGRFVRPAAALVALLPEPGRWRQERLTYARTGLEALWCTRSCARAARPSRASPPRTPSAS